MRLTRLVWTHWELKILSVVIALALWTLVVGGDSTRVALAAPVEYVGLPADLALVRSRETVDLEVEARRGVVERLSPASLRVRVSLSAVGEGDTLVPVDPTQVTSPPGVRVTRISPASLPVSIVRVTSRLVPVIPQIRGTPAAAHAMSGVSVEPAMVEVRGPRAVLDERAAVETVPVDVSGSRVSVVRMVGLVTPDQVSLIRDRAVQVTVEIHSEATMSRGGEGGRR
jgi:YbbR domain-containing protein